MFLNIQLVYIELSLYFLLSLFYNLKKPNSQNISTQKDDFERRN